MFKEVDAKTAVLAAFDGKYAYVITDEDRFEGSPIMRDIRGVPILALMMDSARFIMDDPDYKTPERPTVAVPVYSAEALADAFEEAEHTTTLHFDADDISDIKPGDEKPKPGKTARKDIDMGKVTALHNAGWSIAKIADEMGVSASVIQRRLAALERAKNV